MTDPLSRGKRDPARTFLGPGWIRSALCGTARATTCLPTSGSVNSLTSACRLPSRGLVAATRCLRLGWSAIATEVAPDSPDARAAPRRCASIPTRFAPGAIGAAAPPGLCHRRAVARRVTSHGHDVVHPLGELAGDGDLGLVGGHAARLEREAPAPQPRAAAPRLLGHGLADA